MEIETDSIISDEHIKAAIRFGIEPSNLPNMHTQIYTIAFLKRLLLHNEKIKKNLLEAHLNPMIAKLWQEVLSSLEDTNRKLVNVQSGSLIFTVLCPDSKSLQQLQNEKWRIELQEKVEILLHSLGMLQ